jgi:hypothetical protein
MVQRSMTVTGIGTGVREQVAPAALEDSGRQVRGHALALDTQVLAPLEQTETLHGPGWTGLAREQYLGLHHGVTQALQQAQVRVDGLGAAMGRSAGEYQRLTQARFGPGGPAGAGEATLAAPPTETEYVGANRRMLTRDEVRQLAQSDARVVQRRPLSTDELRHVQHAEQYSKDAEAASANGPAEMSKKCWAVDETGQEALVDGDADIGNLPSGYKNPRPPYPQLTPKVHAYSEELKRNPLPPGNPYNAPQLRPYEPAPHQFDYNRYTGQGYDGQYNLSHAEKQASMRGNYTRDPKVVGINIPQCPDCRRYYQAVAVNRGLPQFISDPEMTRIYYPNGMVGVVVEDSGAQVVYIYRAQDALASFDANGRIP